jgi:hypothetical protein
VSIDPRLARLRSLNAPMNIPPWVEPPITDESEELYAWLLDQFWMDTNNYSHQGFPTTLRWVSTILTNGDADWRAINNP